MKKSIFFLVPALIAFIMIGCGGGPGYTEVKELDTHVDEVKKFSVQYPSNWHIGAKQTGRFSVFTTKEGMNRFRAYDPEGLPAVRIEVTTADSDSLRTIDTIMDKSLRFEKQVYSDPIDVTVDGVSGKKLEYAFELEDGPFHGEIIFAQKDPGTITIFSIEAFGGAFEHYKTTFDEILKTLVLAETPAPVSDTIYNTEELPFPDEELVKKAGKGYSIMIPKNFRSRKGLGKDGNLIKSVMYDGERRGDCYINVDILDASKQNKLDKIVDDNLAKYGNPAKKSTKLGGENAYVLSYNATGTVKRRVYFAVKGDKLFRITMDWFKGEADKYLPIFEKSIASFTFE